MTDEQLFNRVMGWKETQDFVQTLWELGILDLEGKVLEDNVRYSSKVLHKQHPPGAVEDFVKFILNNKGRIKLWLLEKK
jgi:hypothetical protein